MVQGLAVTHIGSNIVFYVNGIANPPIATNGAGDVTVYDLALAGAPNVEAEQFDGLMDDARVYCTALSSNQVKSLYDIGADADGDGLGNYDESANGSSPTNADTDSDGFGDFVEATIYGTSPAISNAAVSASGTNLYVGTGNGVLYTIASLSKFGWATNVSTWRWATNGTGFRADNGSFAISNVPAGMTCYLKSFLDLDGDGAYDANEPGSMPLQSVTVPSGGLTNQAVKVEKIRGMRVDMGYYPGVATTTLVHQIVTNALAWGVNTIYPYSESYEYGVYWNSTNPFLVRTAHGYNDALKLLANDAHSNGIQVIAWVQPANSFKKAWDSNTTWRALLPNGGTYTGTNDTPRKYLLSPFNTNYLAWFDGVIHEILDTGVDGIDISETMTDPTVNTNYTYDAVATNLFFSRYPGGQLGGSDWEALRAEVLTSNIFQRVGALVHAWTNKYYHVTFSWSADSDGVLKTISHYREGTGFDLDGILDLPETSRPDVFNVEFLWQNRRADYGDTNGLIFTPDWVATAATCFVGTVRGRVPVVTHVELTTSLTNSYYPTGYVVSLSAFQTSLWHSVTNSFGGDFYDYHQADDRSAGPTISNVFFVTP